MRAEHQAAVDVLHEIRAARGQEQDPADKGDLDTLNTLRWALRRQTPAIDADLRERAHAAAEALRVALGQ